MDLSKFIEVAGPMRALGVIVTQNGEEIARHLWEGACRRNIYSATKSYTSAAVGLAVKEGLISLNEKLADAYKELVLLICDIVIESDGVIAAPELEMARKLKELGA